MGVPGITLDTTVSLGLKKNCAQLLRGPTKTQATSELRAAPAAPAMKESVTGWGFCCHSSVPNIAMAIYAFFCPLQ